MTTAPQFLTDPTLIREWLTEYCAITGDITISPDGAVSVTGNVRFNDLAQDTLTRIAVNFKHVGGYFSCAHCREFTSLVGSPQSVGGDFACYLCAALTSLEGAPASVGGDFVCSGCVGLTNLVGSPQHVGGDFKCYSCTALTSLEGSPRRIAKSFDCSTCSALMTLQGAPLSIGGDFKCRECANLQNLVGAPLWVGGYFACLLCPNLTSLAGAPHWVGSTFNCIHCEKLKSLAGLGYIGVDIAFTKMVKPEPADVVSLLRHRTKLDTVQNAKWVSIVNDYYKSGDLLTAIAQFEAYFKVPFQAAGFTEDCAALPSL